MIYVIRHQEKLKPVFDPSSQPYSDFTKLVRLSDIGEHHSKLIGKNLAKNCNISAVISSDFVRARQTAEIVGRYMKIKSEVIIDNRLAERRLCQDGVGINKIKDYNKKSLLDWSWRALGGESMNDSAERFKSVVDELLPRFGGVAEDVLLVSHSRVTQAYMAKYTNDREVNYGSADTDFVIPYNMIIVLPKIIV